MSVARGIGVNDAGRSIGSSARSGADHDVVLQSPNRVGAQMRAERVARTRIERAGEEPTGLHFGRFDDPAQAVQIGAVIGTVRHFKEVHRQIGRADGFARRERRQLEEVHHVLGHERGASAHAGAAAWVGVGRLTQVIDEAIAKIARD